MNVPHPTSPAGVTLVWRALAALLLASGASALAGGPGAGTRGGSSTAVTLTDPTRPPAALSAAAPPRAVATALPAGGPGAHSLAVVASAPVAASVLQSLQLPLHGPAVAMVDGRLVKAGDTVGSRTVLSIDGQGLVLRGEGGNERLTLLGGSAKQAPGSITTTRTTRFVAAPALDADPLAQTERSPAGLPQPPDGGTLSLVGRIKL